MRTREKIKRTKREEPPHCPKCGNRATIRSGMVQGEQRWKCKACAYQYTRVTARGRPVWQKSLAVFLYSYGMPLRQIARIFDIQPSTVLKWTRSYGGNHHAPEAGEINLMKLPEIQRHIKKRKRSSKDSALLCIAIDNAAFKQNLGITITER